MTPVKTVPTVGKEVNPCLYFNLLTPSESGGNIDSISKDINVPTLILFWQLILKVLDEIDYDLKNTVFSFIPNTAEVAFYGLVKEIQKQKFIINKPKFFRIEEI